MPMDSAFTPFLFHVASIHHLFEGETFPIADFFWVKVVYLLFGSSAMWWLGRFELFKKRAHDWNGLTALVKLEPTDILGYGPTVCLGASLLGRGSWPPGRLASYAVVALSNPRECMYLAMLWVAIVGGLVMGNKLPWETCVLCCFCAAIVCVGPLQGLLLAFTPVARRRDVVCALAVAILQGVCTVKIGIESDPSSALLRGIIIWFALLLTLATLRTEVDLAIKRKRGLSDIECAELIKAFCEEVEKAALQIEERGFTVEDLLSAYFRYGGTDRMVTRVLRNQLPNGVSREMGIDNGRDASDGDAGTAKKIRVRFDTGASVGKLRVLGHLRRAELVPLRGRRFFVCSNIQRPTIEATLGESESLPIIVGKADLEETADGHKCIDMRQIQVMQRYRQLRLRQVIQDNNESYGPVRGLWSITVEFYLLVTVSTLVVGWAAFGNEDTEAPLTFSIAFTFSAFMLVGPPPDYVAFWRLLERVTCCRCLPDRCRWHWIARDSYAWARGVWLCLALIFFGAAVSTSKMLDSLGTVEVMEVMTARKLAEAVGAQKLAVKVVELEPWTVAWVWLGSYWVVKAADTVLSLTSAARYNGLSTIVYKRDADDSGTDHRGEIIQGCARAWLLGSACFEGFPMLIIDRMLDA